MMCMQANVTGKTTISHASNTHTHKSELFLVPRIKWGKKEKLLSRTGCVAQR
jgi:hypothetical protein